MKRLRNDTYSRQSVDRLHASAQGPGVMLFVLLFASVALLVLSKLDHKIARSIRGTIAEFAQPVLSAVMEPVQPLRRSLRQVNAYFQLYKQMQELQQENRVLRASHARAKELRRRMAHLSRLARVVEDAPYEFISGRVISETGGPFVRIALINAGTNKQVQPGFPVVDADGLVGRIVDAGASASRVLLLSDLNSRLPVLVGPTGIRALLLGDNSALPELEFLPRGSKIAAGDEVITSGVGGVFPRGLRIGVVQPDGRRWRVHLFSRFDQLEYVSVLFYRAPNVDDGVNSLGGVIRRRSRRASHHARATNLPATGQIQGPTQRSGQRREID